MDEDAFVCRKHYHSINVQVICNEDLIFTNAVFKWPGSVADAAIWNQSVAKTILERDASGSVLIGDSGYPLRSYLMTPIMDPLTREEVKYQKSILKTRCSIERTIDVYHCAVNTTGIQSKIGIILIYHHEDRI